jgi:hypothetical protein
MAEIDWSVAPQEMKAGPSREEEARKIREALPLAEEARQKQKEEWHHF